mgnify:FL=1
MDKIKKQEMNITIFKSMLERAGSLDLSINFIGPLSEITKSWSPTPWTYDGDDDSHIFN